MRPCKKHNCRVPGCRLHFIDQNTKCCRDCGEALSGGFVSGLLDEASNSAYDPRFYVYSRRGVFARSVGG